MKRLIITLIAGFTVLHGSAQFFEQTIVSDGLNRTFWIQLPEDESTMDGNLPLIIALHGDGGNGNNFAAYTNLGHLAQQYNYVAVFPNAYTGGWNRAVLGDAPADDLQFMQDIIDYMCVNYLINKRKISVTGHSAGGFLAYRMAIEMPDKIAAISSVAGLMYGDAANDGNQYILDYLGSQNFVKMPIMHIHGDADGTISYPDPDHQPTEWSEFPLTGFSYPTCGATTYVAGNVTDINANVKKIPFCTNGPDSKEISLIRIIGGGHGWPTAQLPDVSERIVQFLVSYERENVAVCHSLGIDKPESSDYQLIPNPVKDMLTINTSDNISSVKVYEMNGKLVQVFTEGSSQISLNGLRPGVYLLSFQTDKGMFVDRIIKE